MTPNPGEVGLFDLGMVEKIRPALVVSSRFSDQDRALVTFVPHTTALRGAQFEIPVRVGFLKPCAFLVQAVNTRTAALAMRKLGSFPSTEFDRVFEGLLRWLGHSPV